RSRRFVRTQKAFYSFVIIMEYAVYKGDDLVAVGTKQECANQLNVKQSTIEFWATPSNLKRDKGKRTVAVRMDGDICD
ncbi:hypothetical protein, partial [Enterococcus wangshanyuanii]|uniref:hypothetical protein n=2 Tax=Enterococcus wangshanyuanii TaxID=2005703 RepID=UPI0027E41178